MTQHMTTKLDCRIAVATAIGDGNIKIKDLARSDDISLTDFFDGFV